MGAQRFGHTASLLKDGTVLIAGGLSSAATNIATVDLAEIYDPSSMQFLPGPAMIQPRQSHTATVLHNGDVLIAGGDNGRDALDSAELFNPARDLFEKVAAVMSAPRTGHTATRLDDPDSVGRVLIAGGSPAFDPATGIFVGSLSTTELFDPRSGGQFELIPVQMNVARSGHSAALLGGTSVLITGGVDQQGLVQSSAEIFEIENFAEVLKHPRTPFKIRFVPAGTMNSPRFFHGSIALQDGTVLIAGGIGADQNVLATAEIYDPVRKLFKPVNAMNEARQSPAMVLLGNGEALIAGGSSDDSAEIYDPAKQTFSLIASSSESQRRSASATLLGNGEVLVAGGFQLLSAPNQPLDVEATSPTAELIDPVAESFAATGSMVMPRTYHTATFLDPQLVQGPLAGTVLIAGGKNLTGVGTVQGSAQLYIQQSGFGTPIAMLEPRFLHTATVLNCSVSGCPDGEALLAGGIGSDGQSTNTTELYADQSFSQSASLIVPRDSATATALGGGRVLIAGGEQIQSGDGGPVSTLLDSAEIYDANSASPSVSCVGGMRGNPPVCNSSMKEARRLHTATLIASDNTILIAGGIAAAGATDSAEIFDPAANGGQGSFEQTGKMTEPRVGHTATYLDPALVTGPLAGKVLIAGGSNDLSAEIYDPSPGMFSRLAANMNAVHSFHTATLLQNGKVLIAGGGAGNFTGLLDGTFVAGTVAEIFDPASETFVRSNGMIAERALQTATLFTSGALAGQVLLVGGEATNSVQAGAELFVPSAAAGCSTCGQ